MAAYMLKQAIYTINKSLLFEKLKSPMTRKNHVQQSNNLTGMDFPSPYFISISCFSNPTIHLAKLKLICQKKFSKT